MAEGKIVLAGSTGDLGERIAGFLIERGASVRALARPGAARQKVSQLRSLGVEVVEVDFGDPAALKKACAGGACVVSALAGLHSVILGAQTALLEAAVAAGVPRFIPSDYSIDFTRLPPGSNRNLDLRREFHLRLDKAPIAATTIFNGAFTDLLTGPAPIILFKLRRVLYWGDADQKLDFTTIDDAAAFTAAAAIDASTPRFLRIAGESLSARELTSVVGKVVGKDFHLFRAGGLGRLALVIKVARALARKSDALYPPWQGMQYLHNMFGGLAQLMPLDNQRYPGMRWTGVRDVLAARQRAAPAGSTD